MTKINLERELTATTCNKLRIITCQTGRPVRGQSGSPVPNEHISGGKAEVSDGDEVGSTAAGTGRCLVGRGGSGGR